MKSSLSKPNFASSISNSSIIPGSARSLSVTASPQVGNATQAIDQRRTLEISSDNFTPWSCRTFSKSDRELGAKSQNNKLW